MSSNTPPPPPDAASLQHAALNYLARYAATEEGLRRVLLRHLDRWTRAQPDPDHAASAGAVVRQKVEDVIGGLVQAGALSDTAFAENRARSLTRAGQSNRAVQARLMAKGVAPDLARAAAANDPENELAAALVLARKRRIGPYRMTEDTAANHTKELARLARAGFSRDIAEHALQMPREEAENRISEFRR